MPCTTDHQHAHRDDDDDDDDDDDADNGDDKFQLKVIHTKKLEVTSNMFAACITQSKSTVKLQTH